MNLSHITSQTLRRVLTLTERKDELINLVAEIETEIARTLGGATTPIVSAATKISDSAISAVKPTAKKGRKASRKGGKKGGTKDRILALLEQAGSQGMRVKDIAAELGKSVGTISVWFSTTGKKLTHKISPGLYSALNSSPAAANPEPAKKDAPAKSRKKDAAKKVAKKPNKKASAKNAAPKKADPEAAAKAAPKARKYGLTPEGRARLAASMKARWEKRRAAASAAAPAK